MKPDLGNRAAFTWLSLHPLSTSLIVIVTGHHFVSDVAIGAGVALVLLSLTTNLSSRRHRRPPFGGPETRGDMTFGGPAITLSPDDQTVSVLHTESQRQLLESTEQRNPMYYVHPQHQLMIHQQRHSQLEAAAAAHRAIGEMPRPGRRFARRRTADHR